MPIHYNNNKIQKEKKIVEKNEIRNNYSEKKPKKYNNKQIINLLSCFSYKYKKKIVLWLTL